MRQRSARGATEARAGGEVRRPGRRARQGVLRPPPGSAVVHSGFMKHAGEPIELARMIPDPPPQRDGSFPPSAKRVFNMQKHRARLEFAQKSFAHWAIWPL